MSRLTVDSQMIFVNAERTILVTVWDSGQMTVAFRADPSHTWGPPITLEEER